VPAAVDAQQREREEDAGEHHRAGNEPEGLAELVEKFADSGVHRCQESFR
jgi:hypothetical protein